MDQLGEGSPSLQTRLAVLWIITQALKQEMKRRIESAILPYEYEVDVLKALGLEE